MKYTNLATKIWEDFTNADLSSSARLVLMNLYTSTKRNLFGITLVHPKSISCETNLSVSAVNKAIAELTEKKFIVPGCQNEYWMPYFHKSASPYQYGNTYRTYYQSVEECNDETLLYNEADFNRRLLSAPAAAALIDWDILTVNDVKFTEKELESARNQHPKKKKKKEEDSEDDEIE